MTVHHLHAWKGSLQNGDKGPKKNMTNLMMHIENIPELGPTIKLNELTQMVEWNGQPFDEATDQIAIRMILDDHKFEPAKGDLYPAILAHARKNAYHPVREYLTSLKWDHIPRIDSWLVTYMGAEDTPFNRLAARKTLIAAVARAMEPGCKVDTMLIIEGEQGIKKSSCIQALFGKRFYTESVNLFRDHQKMVMAMMGAWVIELADLAAVLRKDQNFVKGLMTIQTDKVTLPYAKCVSEHPRQSITIGTYNPESDDEGYLEDTTGNRRYWPVRVHKGDIEAITKYRDQLWAEATKAYLSGEAWWMDSEEETLIAKETATSRTEGDAWADILEGKLHGRNQVTYTEVYSELCLPADRITREAKARVRKAMKSLGFVNQPMWHDGKTRRMWAR